MKLTPEETYNSFIKSWLAGENNGCLVNGNISRYVRRYMFELAGYKCSKCGWAERHPITGNIPLQIHHIDGNCTNNKIKNLQVLCPNCHTLTENFGALNKNSYRKKYQ